ncbi:MAG: flagellar basal-body rod protein FlgF [Variovorax sp.]
MDHLIYTAMSGANATAARQAVLANNLANASTQGFRAELSNFRAVPVNGDGASTRVFALETTTSHDERPGAIQRTGRELDMAAQGASWFAVQGLDGVEAYTRSGAFQVSPQGSLVTSTGLAVLSDGGAPIDVPPGAQLTVGSDGTLSAKTGDAPPALIGRIKLATPAEGDPLKRSEDGLFRTSSQDPVPSDTAARLDTGALEGSNVNPVQTMVGMIAAARQFEQQMRLLQMAESVDKSSAQLLSVQG